MLQIHTSIVNGRPGIDGPSATLLVSRQTRRHADTQTRRHADTQTRRHADTQTRRYADMHQTDRQTKIAGLSTIKIKLFVVVVESSLQITEEPKCKA